MMMFMATSTSLVGGRRSTCGHPEDQNPGPGFAKTGGDELSTEKPRTVRMELTEVDDVEDAGRDPHWLGDRGKATIIELRRTIIVIANT